MNLVNARNSGGERLAHIGHSISGKTLPASSMICTQGRSRSGVAKLKDTLTARDTLGDKGSPITYPPVTLPEPSIAYAIAAKTRNDEDRMRPRCA